MTVYAPGEAWVIVHGSVCAVFDRDLQHEDAAYLHEQLSNVHDIDAALSLLASQRLALLVLVAHDDGWTLARTRGVPAATDTGMLQSSPITGWVRDNGQGPVRFGDITAIAHLPIRDGVVRARGVAWNDASSRVVPVAVDTAYGVTHNEVVSEQVAQPTQSATEVVTPSGLALSIDDDTDIFGETIKVAPKVQSVPEPVQEQQALPEQYVPQQPVTPPVTPPVSPPTPEPVLPPQPVSAQESPPVAQATTASGLIDSVPGYIRPASSVPAAQPTVPQTAPAAVPPAASAPAVPPVVAPVLPPAYEATPAQTHPVAPVDTGLGDHDGMTIVASDARVLAAQAALRTQGTAPVEQGEPATGPLVLSTLCPNSHVQPTGTERCGKCQAPVDPSTSGRRARPEVAALALPTGERVPLGRGVILGRRPKSGRVEQGRVPRLVAVESPNEDVSRSHLEVRFDDWTLVAVDLDSTNGTVLFRPGSEPVRLRPDVPTIIGFGDRLDLGDGVIVEVEPTS